MTKKKKIDVAIISLNLRLDKTREDLMLLRREEKILSEQITVLENIKNDDSYE